MNIIESSFYGRITVIIILVIAPYTETFNPDPFIKVMYMGMALVQIFYILYNEYRNSDSKRELVLHALLALSIVVFLVGCVGWATSTLIGEKHNFFIIAKLLLNPIVLIMVLFHPRGVFAFWINRLTGFKIPQIDYKYSLPKFLKYPPLRFALTFHSVWIHFLLFDESQNPTHYKINMILVIILGLLPGLFFTLLFLLKYTKIFNFLTKNNQE
ncbi:MAG: hypothetical protein OXE77_00080 [Flavobacteriaceae bacterium]|nr:hypothetical protein [Flavobacteriaceae bacterium]MCY4267009.1 hypothetical protein [Flavobacteriaceae bacterium]